MQGMPAFSWEFLTSMPSNGMKAGGLLPAIIGTFYLTLGTAIFAVPLGIAAAIYIAEYAPNNQWTRMIRIAIINLAGIPSVVYGLFGLGLFVVFMKFGTSILAASLTLSIMTLPVIISTTEEALRSVPTSFRVISMSLGSHPLANHLAHSPAAGSARHNHRCHPRSGTSRGRDSSHSVYRSSFLPPASATVSLRCHNGLAVPSICHFHPGSRNAHSNSIWNRAGFAAIRSWHEPDSHHHPITCKSSQTMVTHG